MSKDKFQQYDNDGMMMHHSMTLAEMLREGVRGELEAINQYERYARMTDNMAVAELFQEVANDEKHHVAEHLQLLSEIDELQAEELERYLGYMWD